MKPILAGTIIGGASGAIVGVVAIGIGLLTGGFESSIVTDAYGGTVESKVCTSGEVKDYEVASDLFAAAYIEIVMCRESKLEEACRLDAIYEQRILAQVECFVDASERDLELGIVNPYEIGTANRTLQDYLSYRNGSADPLFDEAEVFAVPAE